MDRYILTKNGEVVYDSGPVPVIEPEEVLHGTVVDSMAAALIYGQTIPDNLGPTPWYWVQEKKWITALEAEKFRAVPKPVEVPTVGSDDGRRTLPSDGSYLTFAASVVGEERVYSFTCERPTQVFAFGPLSGGVGHWEGVTVSLPPPIGTFTNTEGSAGYGVFVPGQNYGIVVKMVNGGAVSLQIQG
jgi:hypothetical protein